jgi:flavin-dependent dehydrogenase
VKRYDVVVIGAGPAGSVTARPAVGLAYREECSKGVAEDQSRILALNTQVQVRAGHYTHVVLAVDYSPIEPDVAELKFYARGSGQAVLAIDISGGNDREKLISYTH